MKFLSYNADVKSLLSKNDDDCVMNTKGLVNKSIFV